MTENEGLITNDGLLARMHRDGSGQLSVLRRPSFVIGHPLKRDGALCRAAWGFLACGPEWQPRDGPAARGWQHQPQAGPRAAI